MLFGNSVGSFDARSGRAQGATAEKLLEMAEDNPAYIHTGLGQLSRQVVG